MLERDYGVAGKFYEWDAQRAVGSRMEAFAKALKHDPQLDGILRERGRELGIIETRGWIGRCGRVRFGRALTQSIGIEHGPRTRSAPSLGR